MTTALVCNFCKSIVLDGGAEMLESTMLEHDLTADEIEAYAVTVHVVPSLPPPATVVVVLLGVVVVLIEVVKVVGFYYLSQQRYLTALRTRRRLTAVVVVGGEPAAPVIKQLHALENFFDLYSHADAKGVGKAVVAVTVLLVYVEQKPAIAAEELTKAAAQASVSGFEQATTAGTAATAAKRTDFILELEITIVRVDQREAN